MSARTGVRRRAVGVGALLAAVLLALLPPVPGPEAAAAESGSSAVTKRGSKGPYDDFSGLEVTVHQTRNLRAQGLRITWKGGKPTQGFNTDYLQIMQCWGDDPAGPRREQCQFGAGVTSGGNFGTHIARRELVPGTDPLERQYAEPIPDPDVPGQLTSPFVPFTPVSGPPTKKVTDWTYFSAGDTNEEFFVATQPDGTGEAAFNLQTTREAPHLGCGDPVGTGTQVRGRGCWLVVVPRGSHEPDGSTGNNHRPNTSPFSTTNWNQRIVFPLDFLPVREPCPTDKAERRMTGSELVTDAVTSWQSALCADGTSRFTFTQRGEDLARSGLQNPTATSPGLAFTVQPVEGTGFVHAPVAVDGLTVGFFWEAGGIGLVEDLKLSPRLLAKLLTASYPYDVRYLTDTAPVPDHLKGNPESVVRDPEFLELNPEFQRSPQAPQVYPGGILLAADRSDSARIVWNYLRSDKEARDFLEGKKDPWGMRVNPYFKELGLAANGADEFMKADPTETELVSNDKTIKYGMIDRSPYALDMHDAARWVRRGTNNAKDQAQYDPVTNGPKLVGRDVLIGQRHAYGITDTASASRYQLQIAALRNADGAYVRPTTTSLLKAVEQFGDSAVPGVLASDPARARNGAYPLTTVTYAAASTALPADARRDYARVLRYAAGPGQKQGTAPGELPFGYAPLPVKLRAQAAAAADRLERGTPAGPGTTTGSTGGTGAGEGAGAVSGTDSGSGSSSGSGSGGAGSTGSGAGGATGSGGGTGTASPSAGPAPASGGGAGGGSPAGQLTATGSTPSQVLGVIRWVLLSVLVAGGLAALAGPAFLGIAGRRRIPPDSPRTGIRHLKSG
ncbi:hypothetical protein ACH4TP_03015 [Streptomyces sp. NPDC021012]|uniref:hypothetical protein n=1 Tax=Streptomyces sp. NPDC021012 TaxID=3365107 RepID=UPI0037A54CD3